MGRFYHYTDKQGYDAIKNSKKIRKSKLSGVDAIFGSGVYLTSLAPEDVFTKGRIAVNNWDGAAQGAVDSGRADFYFEFNIPETSLVKCPDKRDIWLLKDRDLEFDKFSMVDCDFFERRGGVWDTRAKV